MSNSTNSTALTGDALLASRIYTLTLDSVLTFISLVLLFLGAICHIIMAIFINKHRFKKWVDQFLILSSQQTSTPTQMMIFKQREKLKFFDLRRTTRRLYYAFPYWKFFNCCCQATSTYPFIDTLFQAVSNCILFALRVGIFVWMMTSDGITFRDSEAETIQNFWKFLTNVSFTLFYIYYGVVIITTVLYALIRLLILIVGLSLVKNEQVNNSTAPSQQKELSSMSWYQQLRYIANYYDTQQHSLYFSYYFHPVQWIDRICDILSHGVLMLASLAAVSSFIVAFGYWFILRTTSPSSQIVYGSILKHGITFFMAYIDFWLSNQLYPFWYGFVGVIYCGCYLFYLAGLNFLNLPNYSWPYGDLLNFDRSSIAVIFHVVLLAAFLFFFIILFYIPAWIRIGLLEATLAIESKVQAKKVVVKEMSSVQKEQEMQEMTPNHPNEPSLVHTSLPAIPTLNLEGIKV